tara:strand:+ start:250 stop:1014 length:765 start_codon:yes stop_codon:yes gene_type:complete
MDIKPIQIRQLQVPKLESQILPPPVVSSLNPPVTINIGLPIVDMPGCVEARNVTNEGNKTIFGDDPKGVVTLCGPGVPSYDAIDYEPERIILTGPAEPPPLEPPPKSPEVKAPPTPPPPPPPQVQCPTPAQQAKEPVGTLVNGFRERVVGYRLIGRECIQDTEPVSIPEQIIGGLPSGGQVVQVGGVAVIATTSALLAKPLADILLKVVKPTVKKVIKKIAKIRGKKVIVESARDRRAAQRVRNHAIRKLKGKE